MGMTKIGVIDEPIHYFSYVFSTHAFVIVVYWIIHVDDCIL